MTVPLDTTCSCTVRCVQVSYVPYTGRGNYNLLEISLLNVDNALQLLVM